MIFTLDVIRARKGDCLILHYGTKADPHLIMIDGGPSKVYGPHLKPRLKQIRDDRELAEDEPLPVDLLMVSHVDDDHINGILALTSELRDAEMSNGSQLVQVLSIWHNSFENIIGHTPDELTAAFTSQFGAASMDGDPPSDLTLVPVDPEVNEKDVAANLKVLASIKQGAQLRVDIDKLGLELNPEFNGDLIMTEAETETLNMGDGLKFTIVGPMLPELKRLHKKHQDWLKALAAENKTPEDVLSAYVDTSIPNLSSIVVLAEVEGKRILFTGDALGNKVLKGLELVGLLEPGEKMHVDILKGPHHGSANNVAQDFFERITADHYVFSGNGEHGNPEREALEMLLAARGDADYEVHLTYPIDELDVGRKIDWEESQATEKTKKLSNPNQKVRDDWSDEKNSLAALLQSEEDFAKKFRFVEDNKPYLINLLDEM
jgi:hypothetical protein